METKVVSLAAAPDPVVPTGSASEYVERAIVVQVAYADTNNTITITVEQSLDGVSWDKVRDESFEPYELEIAAGTGVRVFAFEKIHCSHVRIVIARGSATAGTLTMTYQTMAVDSMLRR